MEIVGLRVRLAIAFGILAFTVLVSSVGNAEPGGQKAGGPPSSPASQAANPAATPGQAASTPGSSGSGGLQGISYARASWATDLKLPTAEILGINQKDLAKDRVVLLYRLVPGNSAAQPFILESSSFTSWRAKTPYTAGTWVTPTPKNGHYYQARTQSNATPPIWPLDGTTVRENPGLYWTDMGPIPVGLTPPTWRSNAIYEAGTQILPNPTNGHYYEAQTPDVVSNTTAPTWSVDGATVADSSGLYWTDMGLAWDSVNPKHPLLMNQFLVLAIDMRAIPNNTWERFKILNLNITTQQGSSLNPTPIRPSIAAGTASGAAAGGGLFGLVLRPAVYYLTWPNQLPGDTIITVSVNLVYTPAAPALPLQPNTFYPAGSIVISQDNSGGTQTTNGHYYVALNSGVSSASPNFNTGLIPVQTFREGSGITWKDMGLIGLNPTPPAWQQNYPYANGALIIPTVANGHYYKAQSNGGRSGAGTPAFPVDGTSVAENANLSWKDMGLITLSPAPPTWSASTAYAVGAQVTPSSTNGHYYVAQSPGVTGLTAPAFPLDGSAVIESTGIVWEDVGSTMPSGAKVKAWAPNTPYVVGDVLQDASSGHYYSATQPGISGTTTLPFQVPAPQVVPAGSITWQDLGTSLPASVSVGTPPSDQSVNLLTYTFNQSHALSYFNLASGVVLSSIKNRSFVNLNSPGSQSNPNPPVWSTITKGRTIDPILAVTAYVFGPMDAERPFQKRDLIPGATIGISLSNPTTNFYFGGSSELFIRNLQVVYGFALNRVMTLDSPSVQFNPSTPVTRLVSRI